MRNTWRRESGDPVAAVGVVLAGIEGWVGRSSAAVVTISDDFAPILRSWGVAPERVHVIENWAPLDEIPQRPRDNEFAREHGLEDAFVVMYAGTLGLKHDPSSLLALAEHFADRPDVKVVVVSERIGAVWLAERGSQLPGLVQLPYQPYDKLADMLASADVLCVDLEPDGRRVLRAVQGALVPLRAAAHCSRRFRWTTWPRIISREESGICVEPGAVDDLIAAAARFDEYPELRTTMGANARAYAERTFDIDRIGRAFLEIIHDADAPRRSALGERLVPDDGFAIAVGDRVRA